MKSKTLAILVGAVTLLALIAVVANQAERSQRDARLGGGPLLTKFDPTAIHKLEIDLTGTTTTLTRSAGGWTLAPDFRADADALDDVLGRLRELDRRDLAATVATNHAAFDVIAGSGRAIAVRLYREASGETPDYRVVIGKDGPDLNSTYVRRDDDDHVYLSQSAIRYSFDRGGVGFRDRSVVSFDPNQARSLDLTADGHTTQLVRGEDLKWSFTAPTPGPANDAAVDAVLRQFSDLEADDFPRVTDPSITGLDAPQGNSQVTLADGKVIALDWGREDGGRVFLKKPTEDTVYAVFAFKQKSILVGASELAPLPTTDSTDQEATEGPE